MAELLTVRAGRLLDVASGEILPDRRLVVRDGRVEAVLGPDKPGPAGRPELDLGGLTVLPGLIDCHTHLIGQLEFADVPAIGQTAAQELEAGIANARATLHAGFTTVRDVGTFRAFLDIELRDAIEAGRVDGPRMQCAGAYVTAVGGGGEITGLADGPVPPPEMRVGVVRSPAEVRAAVRRIVDAGADLVKVIATGAVLTRGTRPGDVELGLPELEAAVDEAARHDRFVAAHAPAPRGSSWRSVPAPARSSTAR